MAPDVLMTVLTAAWVILPAYFANSSAVYAGGLGVIDGGRTMSDGRRIFGDGKTWSGLLGGTAIGTGVGLALEVGRVAFVQSDLVLPTYGPLPTLVLLPMATALGALVGDLAASFLKRRIGKARGEPWPGVDQLDFVAGALGLSALASWGLGSAWFSASVTVPVLVTILVLTPIVHFGANVAGHRLGHKEVPW